jgi:hypothetical protein
MKTTTRTLAILACLAACAAAAEEPPALSEPAAPPRWRVSVGVRLAPGVKTRATVPSRAVLDTVGRLPGANGSSRGAALPSGTSTSTRRSSTTSSEDASESVAVTPTSRLEFDNGFIDMNDTTADPYETWYWHFDSAAAFDEAAGRLSTVSTPSTETSTDSTSSRIVGQTVSSVSSRTTSSETAADVSSSREDDLWGADLEIGCDLWRGERFSLGVGLGATLYRCEDAVRAAGRCYAASSSTVRESASGRFTTTTETTIETTETTTETTTFTDSSFTYPGALDDLRNDDYSYGAGDREGDENIYGGGNPALTLTDGSVTRTTSTETRKDTTATTTRAFEATGSKSSRTSSRRVIDVAAEGDVETQEIRLALQPAWKATDWLTLRGTFGAVATRVSVDTDATILVNGARFTTVSGDDSDWVFAGLCGLDAVVSPLDWLSVFVGADVRMGGNTFDYEAGLVRGSVELARATYRAGIAIRF